MNTAWPKKTNVTKSPGSQQALHVTKSPGTQQALNVTKSQVHINCVIFPLKTSILKFDGFRPD